jgi:predicted DNA-binding transcriptional regulator
MNSKKGIAETWIGFVSADEKPMRPIVCIKKASYFKIEEACLL